MSVYLGTNLLAGTPDITGKANTSLNNLDSTGQAVIDGKVDLDLNNMNPSATAKEIIVGWSMPSNRYTDLTLGASGATYTAPANGWFSCIASGNTSSSYLHLINNSSGVEDVMQLNGRMALLLPAKKGETVKLNYNGISTWVGFKFIYSEGET